MNLVYLGSGERLDLFLARQTSQSRSFVQHQIKHGRVRVNSQPETKSSTILRPGDVVDIEFEQTPYPNLAPVPGPLHILFEDEHLLILNKAADTVVHPATGHRGETLVHYLLHYFGNSDAFLNTSETRPGIVHRLDKGTSGLLVIAKNRPALENISAQFKARTVKKEYEAIAWGRMAKSGRFKDAIGRDPKDRKKISSKSHKTREAQTDWASQTTFAHFTHVRLWPKTGRTHQLRVHLAENGHPIVGDPTYGKGSLSRRLSILSSPLKESAQSLTHTLLHAGGLELDHPQSGNRLSFQAPRPPDFEQFLALLGTKDTI